LQLTLAWLLHKCALLCLALCDVLRLSQIQVLSLPLQLLLLLLSLALCDVLQLGQMQVLLLLLLLLLLLFDPICLLELLCLEHIQWLKLLLLQLL
jgi:hypothetical protein